MAFGNDKPNGEAISQINVTPLVDVMLVLLVIFMVTAPILQQGISVQLPRARAAAMAGEERGLVVSLTADRKIFLNDTLLRTDDLQSRLRSIIGREPDRQVFLRADSRVPYGEVMGLMAAIKEAGVQRLGMVTEPPSANR